MTFLPKQNLLCDINVKELFHLKPKYQSKNNVNQRKVMVSQHLFLSSSMRTKIYNMNEELMIFQRSYKQ